MPVSGGSGGPGGGRGYLAIIFGGDTHLTEGPALTGFRCTPS